ncbi:50S ribosomal protein L32 [Schleiferilactobacillus perolens]|jgi:large subunit ribosomal protein L32|uniref:50S ribosomal protein L32 n=1 Tax=Schleiferilactobacillus perolens TaxID=100468 RepID=UPI00070FB591|nr:50S ribosomal protein L32 [Schleiferilactobacillus perolens]MCI1891159.1 50S ribosomal protein L32 [Schleiferilactobacillus harbinensis]MCI1912479.1 50S ribosomal protein L32 [Schleiferilactobacillus harbinensis]MCI2171238.1 50S ribosomal protein L32 [Schleiferilactobacillus perolens]
MAVPARRTSKTKKRMRRGHIKLTVPNMHFDAATGEYRLSHHVSPKGFYKGEQVVKKAADDSSDNK